MGQSVEVTRIITRRTGVGEIILNRLKGVDIYAPLLDIGMGNGRLLNSLHQVGFMGKYIGLDLDKELVRQGKEAYPNHALVYADALTVPLASGYIGTITSLNIAHEICYERTTEDRKNQFRLYVREMHRLLKQGGTFVLFDGVMPEEHEAIVKMYPANLEDASVFRRFAKEYEAMPIVFSDIGYFELQIRALAAFQTKLGYMHQSAWEGEKKQLYPFLTATDITSVLTEEGFNITCQAHPQGRTGVDEFLKRYLIHSRDAILNVETFPQTQVVISAQKN